MVEHPGHRGPQCFRAVDNHQDRTGGVQTSLPQPDEQVGHHGGVFGVTIDQGQRMLGAIDADAQRDNADMLSEADAVEHQRHQVQVPERAGQQLTQSSLGGLDKPPRHSRLAGRGSGLVDLLADWFQADLPAAGGDPGQHLRHGHPPEHLSAGKQLIRRHRQLTRTVARAHSRPLDGHPAPAQGDRATLAAVAHRGPVGIVLALGPAHRSHIGVHHRHHHLQSGAHGHRQQALANIGNDFTDRHRHRLRHRQRFYGSINRLIVLFHSGPLSFSRIDLAVAQHLAHARHQAGDRHLKIHDVRDNLEGGSGCDSTLRGGRALVMPRVRRLIRGL